MPNDPKAVEQVPHNFGDAYREFPEGLFISKFRYDITAVAAGWQITCNGISGPAYASQNAAVSDTLSIAERLRRDSHEVEVRLFEIDGIARVLETRDAKLFSR